MLLNAKCCLLLNLSFSGLMAYLDKGVAAVNELFHQQQTPLC